MPHDLLHHGAFCFKQLICRLAYAAFSECVHNQILITIKPGAADINIRCRGFWVAPSAAAPHSIPLQQKTIEAALWRKAWKPNCFTPARAHRTGNKAALCVNGSPNAVLWSTPHKHIINFCRSCPLPHLKELPQELGAWLSSGCGVYRSHLYDPQGGFCNFPNQYPTRPAWKPLLVLLRCSKS